MSDKRKDVLLLQEHLELCQDMLDKGDVEGVKSYLGYKPGNEKYLIDGMPFARRLTLWIQATDGVFSLDDIHKTFGINTTRSKNNVSKIVERLKADEKIKRVGSKMGTYIKIGEALEEMDWKNADTIPLKLNFPLHIGDFYQPYPKNMGVIAGAKDSGKTAVLIDFVKLNQDLPEWKNRIHFYTNEMGKEELKVRILKHDDLPIEKWNFHAYECTSNYEDHIARYPDDIHVIDYIEVNDTFYLIGEYLKRIHEALGKGFVLLGLQKDWGAPLGRGAAFSIQRPRLYITLERGYARVASAKNRTPDCTRSPVGDILFYGIIDGWKIVCKDLWHPEMPYEIDNYLGEKKGVHGGYGYGNKESY